LLAAIPHFYVHLILNLPLSFTNITQWTAYCNSFHQTTKQTTATRLLQADQVADFARHDPGQASEKRIPESHILGVLFQAYDMECQRIQREGLASL
jgi:hypothetical protein